MTKPSKPKFPAEDHGSPLLPLSSVGTRRKWPWLLGFQNLGMKTGWSPIPQDPSILGSGNTHSHRKPFWGDFSQEIPALSHPGVSASAFPFKLLRGNEMHGSCSLPCSEVETLSFALFSSLPSSLPSPPLLSSYFFFFFSLPLNRAHSASLLVCFCSQTR